MSWYLAGTLAGCMAATASLPFDNAKTKMQKMRPNAEGILPYKNLVHCMQMEVARNGALGLWAGLPTYCFRCVP